MTDIPKELLIEVDIRNYWHAGTGRAGGDDVDALIDKDVNGLPVLRGRHLKGLVRDAAECLAAWDTPGWTEPARTNILFGREAIRAKPADGGKPAIPGQASTPACVRFSDACLPPEIADKVRAKPKLANGLIQRLASTRIEFETGAATDETLRSIEAAIPLKLYARLRWDTSERFALLRFDGEETEEQITELGGRWAGAITECLPYVLAVGAHRSRGFGRTVLSIVEG